MNQLACLLTPPAHELTPTLHPFVRQVIAQAQEELLADSIEAQQTLLAVLNYFEGKSKKWPRAATPELRLAMDGLRLLHRHFNLDVIDISLELRKKQILEAIGQ